MASSLKRRQQGNGDSPRKAVRVDDGPHTHHDAPMSVTGSLPDFKAQSSTVIDNLLDFLKLKQREEVHTQKLLDFQKNYDIIKEQRIFAVEARNREQQLQYQKRLLDTDRERSVQSHDNLVLALVSAFQAVSKTAADRPAPVSADVPAPTSTVSLQLQDRVTELERSQTANRDLVQNLTRALEQSQKEIAQLKSEVSAAASAKNHDSDQDTRTALKQEILTTLLDAPSSPLNSRIASVVQPIIAEALSDVQDRTRVSANAPQQTDSGTIQEVSQLREKLFETQKTVSDMQDKQETDVRDVHDRLDVVTLAQHDVRMFIDRFKQIPHQMITPVSGLQTNAPVASPPTRDLGMPNVPQNQSLSEHIGPSIYSSPNLVPQHMQQQHPRSPQHITPSRPLQAMQPAMGASPVFPSQHVSAPTIAAALTPELHRNIIQTAILESVRAVVRDLPTLPSFKSLLQKTNEMNAWILALSRKADVQTPVAAGEQQVSTSRRGSGDDSSTRAEIDNLKGQMLAMTNMVSGASATANHVGVKCDGIIEKHYEMSQQVMELKWSLGNGRADRTTTPSSNAGAEAGRSLPGDVSTRLDRIDGVTRTLGLKVEALESNVDKINKEWDARQKSINSEVSRELRPVRAAQEAHRKGLDQEVKTIKKELAQQDNVHKQRHQLLQKTTASYLGIVHEAVNSLESKVGSRATNWEAKSDGVREQMRRDAQWEALAGPSSEESE